MFLLRCLLFFFQIKVKVRYDESHDLSFQLELVKMLIELSVSKELTLFY